MVRVSASRRLHELDQPSQLLHRERKLHFERGVTNRSSGSDAAVTFALERIKFPAGSTRGAQILMVKAAYIAIAGGYVR
jgi:hypothetical protein